MPLIARWRAAPGLNEKKYPHIVELAVGKHGLDVGLGRRVMHFHNSRHIKARHGHIVLKNGQTYYRWCFSDLTTAQVFIEEFGGTIAQALHAVRKEKRLARRRGGFA